MSNDSGPQTIIDPVNVTDSNYLDKMYALYDIGSGIDTQDIFTFKYDALKRVVSVHDSTITPGGNVHYSSYYFYYNGADTICNKSIEVFTETTTDLDSTIAFYYYDNTLRKVKDSAIDISYVSGVSDYRTLWLSNYTYAAGFRYAAASEHTNNLTTPVSSYTINSLDTATLDSRSNMIAFDSHSIGTSSVPGGNSTSYAASRYTFDTHLNPLAKLSFFRALDKGDRQYFLPLFVSANNITQDKPLFNPPSFTINFTYQYNNAGYPVRCTTSGNDVEQIIFRYKTL